MDASIGPAVTTTSPDPAFTEAKYAGCVSTGEQIASRSNAAATPDTITIANQVATDYATPAAVYTYTISYLLTRTTQNVGDGSFSDGRDRYTPHPWRQTFSAEMAPIAVGVSSTTAKLHPPGAAFRHATVGRVTNRAGGDLARRHPPRSRCGCSKCRVNAADAVKPIRCDSPASSSVDVSVRVATTSASLMPLHIQTRLQPGRRSTAGQRKA